MGRTGQIVRDTKQKQQKNTHTANNKKTTLKGIRKCITDETASRDI